MSQTFMYLQSAFIIIIFLCSKDYYRASGQLNAENFLLSRLRLLP